MTLRMLVVFFITMGLLTACSPLSKQATRYYVLTPIEQTTLAKTNRALGISIASVRLPPYLDKPYIVSRNSQNSLSVVENHRWGGKLRKNMARVMAQNLSTLLNTENISIAPNSIPISPEVILEVTILQFERNKDSRVQLNAQWRIVKGKDLSPLMTKVTNLQGEVIQDTVNYDATISSMSVLYGQLGEVIARNLIDKLKL